MEPHVLLLRIVYQLPTFGSEAAEQRGNGPQISRQARIHPTSDLWQRAADELGRFHVVQRLGASERVPRQGCADCSAPFKGLT